MALLAPLVQHDAGFKIGQDFSRNYTNVFTGYFDFDDTDEDVRIGCGIVPNTPHPYAPHSYVISVEGKMETEGRQTFWNDDATGSFIPHPANNTDCRAWTITVEYGPWSPVDFAPGNNPLNLPPWAEFDWVEKQVPRFLDEDGNPILNSAYDCYDPPLTIPKLNLVIKVHRNEATPGAYVAAQLSNTTNAATWNGFPTGTVRCMPIRIPKPEYAQDSGIVYYPKEYCLEVDLDGWKAKLLNQGYRQLGPNGKPVRILDAYGAEISQPALLDALGKALATPITSSSIIINEYTVYPPADFSFLDITL